MNLARGRGGGPLSSQDALLFAQNWQQNFLLIKVKMVVISVALFAHHLFADFSIETKTVMQIIMLNQ